MVEGHAPPGRLRAARAMIEVAWAADRRRTVLALLVFTLEAAATSLLGLWLKLLLDAVLARHPLEVAGAVAAIALSIAGGTWLDYAGSRVRAALNERAHHLIERRLLEVVGRTPTLEIHETPAHLTQLELLDSESWEFGEAIPSLVRVASTGVRIVATALLLLSVHPLLLLLPLFGLPTLLLSSRTAGLYNLGNELAAEPARRAVDLFELATTGGPAKEIRLFRLHEELGRRFHQAHREVRRIHQRLQIRGQVIGLASRLVFLAGYFGAIVLATDLVISRRASIGAVLLTAVLAGQVLGLIAGSAEVVQWTLRTLSSAGRYVYLVDVGTRARGAVDRYAPAPDRLTEGIRLEQVSYRYPGAGHNALHSVDLLLPAGSTVALVGDNGSGKTTLVKLLAGLCLPASGRITVDGVSLADLNPERWRERLAATFQDHGRFELLVQQTVGLGELAAIDDEDRVAAAMERAGALDVLDALPAGLSTRLGPSWPGGIDLSGGQWQKLALARGMMRTRPLLLLLDEPTAALDAETEHQLFQRWTLAARNARQTTGAVTILVSHRFSTVRMADLIVVLDHGSVAEVGTHAELIARGGLYAELFALQSAAYR